MPRHPRTDAAPQGRSNFPRNVKRPLTAGEEEEPKVEAQRLLSPHGAAEEKRGAKNKNKKMLYLLCVQRPQHVDKRTDNREYPKVLITERAMIAIVLR